MPVPPGRTTNDPANYLAISCQSAKDVDGTTFYFLKHLDGSGFDVAVNVSSEREGGAGREISLRYRTKVTADGQYLAYARPDFAGRVFAAALGTDTVGASQAGGFYPHTITSGGTTLPYYTIEQSWADETERTTNCIISSLKAEGEAGHPVKLTAQFISGGTAHAQSAALSPVREAALPLMVPGGSVAITATGNLSAGLGASSLQITKWSLEIKNTLDDAIQTTSLNREDVTWLNTDFDSDGTFKYINKDFWNAVQYGGGTQVPTGFLTSGQFFFYTPGASGGALTLFAPYMEFSAVKVNRLDPDGKTMYLDYTAATRNIGTSSMQVTVLSQAAASYTLSTT